MAQVIQAGVEGFEALIYPTQNPVNYEFIQNQFANIGNIASESVRGFYEKAQSIAQRFYDSSAVRHARAAVRAIRNAFEPNSVQYLPTLEAMQQASPVMIRYMMAEPTLRGLYQNQMCAGYGDSYFDMEPGRIGEDHYDYRRVMNGIAHEEEGQDDLVFNHYAELLHEGDRELDAFEQFGVLDTWSLAKMFIAAGKDPSSPEGDDL
jgi:hypothetical protein